MPARVASEVVAPGVWYGLESRVADFTLVAMVNVEVSAAVPDGVTDTGLKVQVEFAG